MELFTVITDPLNYFLYIHTYKNINSKKQKALKKERRDREAEKGKRLFCEKRIHNKLKAHQCQKLAEKLQSRS